MSFGKNFDPLESSDGLGTVRIVTMCQASRLTVEHCIVEPSAVWDLIELTSKHSLYAKACLNPRAGSAFEASSAWEIEHNNTSLMLTENQSPGLTSESSVMHNTGARNNMHCQTL